MKLARPFDLPTHSARSHSHHNQDTSAGIKENCPLLCQRGLQLRGTTQSQTLSHAIPVKLHTTISHLPTRNHTPLNALPNRTQSFMHAQTLRAVIQVFTEFFRAPYFCTIKMICSKCFRVSSSAALWPRGPLTLPCYNQCQPRPLEPRLTPVHATPVQLIPFTVPRRMPKLHRIQPRSRTRAQHDLTAHNPNHHVRYLLSTPAAATSSDPPCSPTPPNPPSPSMPCASPYTAAVCGRYPEPTHRRLSPPSQHKTWTKHIPRASSTHQGPVPTDAPITNILTAATSPTPAKHIGPHLYLRVRAQHVTHELPVRTQIVHQRQNSLHISSQTNLINPPRPCCTSPPTTPPSHCTSSAPGPGDLTLFYLTNSTRKRANRVARCTYPPFPPPLDLHPSRLSCRDNTVPSLHTHKSPLVMQAPPHRSPTPLSTNQTPVYVLDLRRLTTECPLLPSVCSEGPAKQPPTVPQNQHHPLRMPHTHTRLKPSRIHGSPDGNSHPSVCPPPSSASTTQLPTPSNPLTSHRKAHATILQPTTAASTHSSPSPPAATSDCGLACCSASVAYLHPLLALPVDSPGMPRSSSLPAAQTSVSSSSVGLVHLATPACPAYLHPFPISHKSAQSTCHALATGIPTNSTSPHSAAIHLRRSHGTSFPIHHITQRTCDPPPITHPLTQACIRSCDGHPVRIRFPFHLPVPITNQTPSVRGPNLHDHKESHHITGIHSTRRLCPITCTHGVHSATPTSPPHPHRYTHIPPKHLPAYRITPSPYH